MEFTKAVPWVNFILYPCGRTVGLVFQRSRVRASLAAASIAICSQHLHRAIRGAKGVLLCIECGITASQVDLPSLTPLSVAGCGRLLMEAPHWVTSVELLQVVDI